MGIIYRAINIENGMSYIGQTCKSLKWRINKHKNDAKIFPNRKFYKALNSYDFKWEILEKNVPKHKILEVEMNYILKYNAYEDGYNSKNCFEESYKITDDSILEIIDLLKCGKHTLKEIAKIYNISECHISSINKGLKWHFDDINYPIYNTNRSEILTKENVLKIKEMLKTTKYSQKDIAEKFGIIRKRITDINNGKTFYDCDIDYPIRKYKNNNYDQILNIIKDIKDTNISFSDISLKYGVHKSKIYRINNGELDYCSNFDDLKFPLREIEGYKNSKPRTNVGIENYLKMFDLLKNTDIPYKEISKITGFEKSTIVRFNNGKTEKAKSIIKDMKWSTPIRKK